MTEAYVPKKANDVIRADDWNNAQIAAREHVLGHSHSGEADQGKKLDGTAIKTDAELTVKSVTASEALQVKGREILAELDALMKGVDAVSLKAGGTVAGNLTVLGGHVAVKQSADGSSGIIMGPWPPNRSGYAMVGSSALDQGKSESYALLVGTGEESGRTFLNSPTDIRFRIKNADKMVLDKDGNISIGTPDAKGNLTVSGTVEAAALAAPSLRLTRKQKWIEVAKLLNGWANYGGGWHNAAYFKDELGFVHLRGLIKGGKFDIWSRDNTFPGTIFDLPEGFRPQVRYLRGFRLAAFRGLDLKKIAGNPFGVAALAGLKDEVSEPQRVDVLPTGQVCAVGDSNVQDNGWVSIDGITFAAAD